MQTQLGTDCDHQRRAQRIVAAVERIFAEITPVAYLPPVRFCESVVDLGADKTAASSGLIRIREITPYLVDPVDYFERRGKCCLTVQAVEQTAKSTCWKMGAIWRLRNIPTPAAILYQNEDVGRKIIKDSLLPMMRCVPEFRRAIPERANENPRSLDLPNAPVYLMSAEQAIISIPLGLIIGDEINKWRQEKANRNKKKISSDEDYQVSKLRDMDKRTRTFPDSLRVLVCSPEGRNAPITTEFKKSSMGVYHCRCAKCGDLTFDTTLPEEYFVYESDSGTVRRESVRLRCPKCGNLHDETQKAKITRGGGYIHEHPERFDYHAGFCWGALAAQFPGVDWRTICQAIEDAKNSNSYETQAYLCNSIKGVEFVPTVITGEKMDVIRGHWIPELPAGIEFTAVYMGVDTQETGYWFAIMAIDRNGNWFTLDYGFAWNDEAVVETWNKEYCGIQPMAGIIDEGGHRKPDVDNLLSLLGSGFYKYKGEGGNRKEPFRISENDEFLVLAQAKYYQSKLLYLIYSQHRQNNNYWFICCEIKKTLVYQMASVQAPSGRSDADFEEWTPYERQHDLFDAHKMCLTLHDFACEEFPDSFWIHH